ncbi:MAG TPA: 3-dehydroquinate synthase [Sulfurospirillum sp. UBA12182]|jgi:3-dehydroquinate synthase|nr:MAG TPA: 3-dehydroquinate synthase [Sulfurospirillum sp. UBA12182]
MIVDISFEAKKSNSYKVIIDELKEIKLETKVIVVTNPTVAKLHLENFLKLLHVKELHIIQIPDGEKFKTLDTLNMILEGCFENKLDRKSTLIAFGGGVVGDMTGFAASIYQRGIDFIQVPTTLLSQVDASVGGKTGINNKFGKNLIGTFWQPRAVYCETEFLKTLPQREFSAGVAEIIKMAVTFDREFFEWLENNSLHVKENLAQAVKKCVQIKADVVASDEREEGIRAVLNYGHTFAHVIENQTAYKRYLHGEAVAMGIDMANSLALKLGLIQEDELLRIRNLLMRYNLPVSYKITSPEEFYEAFFLDKKSHNSKIKFILPHSIGNFEMRDDIPKETVIKTLGEYNA